MKVLDRKYIVVRYDFETSLIKPYIEECRTEPRVLDSEEDAEEYMIRECLYGDFWVIMPIYQRFGD
jgi:hypothetical protein